MAVATQRRRGRQRSFDYDEARRLHAEGASVVELRARFGVSHYGITYALLSDAERRAEIDERNRRQAAKRKPCLGGCGRLVWQGKGRSGKCLRCSSAEKASSVRETTLRCSRCREWKPDEAFPARASAVSRRGRAATCTPCDTVRRTENRNAKKIPCERCGRPRLHPSDTGGLHRGLRDSGLCGDCYHKPRAAA